MSGSVKHANKDVYSQYLKQIKVYKGINGGKWKKKYYSEVK